MIKLKQSISNYGDSYSFDLNLETTILSYNMVVKLYLEKSSHRRQHQASSRRQARQGIELGGWTDGREVGWAAALAAAHPTDTSDGAGPNDKVWFASIKLE